MLDTFARLCGFFLRHFETAEMNKAKTKVAPLEIHFQISVANRIGFLKHSKFVGNFFPRVTFFEC